MSAGIGIDSQQNYYINVLSNFLCTTNFRYSRVQLVDGTLMLGCVGFNFNLDNFPAETLTLNWLCTH